MLSVELLIRAALSRPVSNMVVISEFSSYVSMGEGSGYLSRGVCFWSPLLGVLLFTRQESLGYTPGVFPGRISGVPGTGFGSSRDEFREFPGRVSEISETAPATSAGRA